MEMSIYSTIVSIIIIIEFSLAAIVFFESERFSAKVFSSLIFLHALWSTLDAALHSATQQSLADFLTLYVHFLGGVLASVFFYFALSYPRDEHPDKKVFFGIIALQVVLLFLYGNGLVIESSFFVDGTQKWGWDWGPLWFLFHATFFGFYGAGLAILLKKAQNGDSTEKKSLGRMFVTMIVSIVPITVGTIILPALGIFSYGWIGSATSFVWVLALSASLIEHHRMNVRAILAEIFVLAAAMILFVNIFIGSSEGAASFVSPETVLRTIIFVAFFVVGYLLIVNVLKESEQKERIEKLNAELGTLNAELEKKVEDRTQALNTSRKHIEIVLENLTVGIIEYDAGFTVFRMNKAAEQMIGVLREDAIGKTVSVREIGSLRPLSRIMYDWKTKKTSAEDITYNEIRVETPKHRDLQVITIPIRNIPFIKISGFVKLLRDMTHEKAIDRGKSDFISIVAHQLSAPLEAAAWALREILAGNITEKQREFLEKILSSNKNLSQITADLLVAARIEGEEFRPIFEEHDILETVKTQLVFHEPYAQEKKIELLFNDRAPDLAPFVFDREKIMLALRNVLSNALDYTPQGGKVTVTVSKTTDGFVTIQIQDTGIGIPKEELNRIFTKFYRSKEALLMETDRSGLGLYITKNIVDMHRGTIVLESEEGAGVTVRIRIPMDISSKESSDLSLP